MLITCTYCTWRILVYWSYWSMPPPPPPLPPQSSSHSSSLLQSQVLWNVWYRQQVIRSPLPFKRHLSTTSINMVTAKVTFNRRYTYNDTELLQWETSMLNSWLCTYLTYTDHILKLTLPFVLHIAILLQFTGHTHVHLSIPGTKEARFIVHTHIYPHLKQ